MNSTSAVETRTHEVSPAFTLPPSVVYVTTGRLPAVDDDDVSSTALQLEQRLHDATRAADERVAPSSSTQSRRYPESRTLWSSSPSSPSRWRTRTIIVLRADRRGLPPVSRYALASSAAPT